MKILIVAQARSGSNFLVKKIQEKTKLPTLLEPFNVGLSGLSFEEEATKIAQSRDILVKIVDNHFFKITDFKNPENLFKNFDKVIGLTRKNDTKTGISRYAAIKTNYWNDGNTSSFFKNTKMPKVEKKEIEECINFSKNIRLQIESFNIFQITYEDLFYKNGLDKVFNYLDIG